MTVRAKPIFLIKEVEDRHAQENWWKLKQYIDDFDSNASTTINNIINASGLSPWTKFSKVIPASTNYVADTTLFTNFTCIDYAVCMQRASGGTEARTLNVKVRKNNTDVEDQVFGIEGDSLDVDVDVIVNGSNLELKFDNSEAFDVNLIFTKLLM